MNVWDCALRPASLAEIPNNIGTLGRMPTVGISGGQDINPAISETKIRIYCVFLSYEDRKTIVYCLAIKHMIRERL